MSNLKIQTDADGRRYLVRKPYRPEDYTIPPHELRALRAWSGEGNVDELKQMHDGPFAGWTEIERYEKDGNRWVLFANGDWYIEAQRADSGVPEIRAVPPDQAYRLACEQDKMKPLPVVHEP
jgi:hypothetical protein